MLNRIVAVVLVLLLLSGSALAQNIVMEKEQLLVDGIQIRLDSAELRPEWKGESVSTHKWIIVWFTLTNYRKEAFDAASNMEAKLEYFDGYLFTGSIDIQPKTLDPLVRASGALVFHVPNLVAQADPHTLGFTLQCEGQAYAFHPRYTKALSESNQVFCETPGEAVLYFHRCVSSGDFNGALCVMAAQSMAEGYDYIAYVNRIGAIAPTMQMPFPNTAGNEYLTLNKISLQAAFTRQLYSFLTSLLIAPHYDPYKLYAAKEGKVEIPGLPAMTVEEFAGSFDPVRLSGLKLRFLAQLDSDIFKSERHQENLREQGAIYGYSQQVELTAIYGFEGKNWAHGYTVAKFEQGWQIIGLNGQVSGFPSLGIAIPVDEMDINELRNSGDYLLLYETPEF